MAQEDALATLSSLLSSSTHVISYEPLRTEVPISSFIPIDAIVHTVPARASLDPFATAIEVNQAIGTNSALLLIPGRMFDTFGTRHGQGGGWYDRFLSRVPREWLRIGFCYDSQLSPTPLKRESWDQAMDYVVVVSRTDGAVALYSSEGTSHD